MQRASVRAGFAGGCAPLVQGWQSSANAAIDYSLSKPAAIKRARARSPANRRTANLTGTPLAIAVFTAAMSAIASASSSCRNDSCRVASGVSESDPSILISLEFGLAATRAKYQKPAIIASSPSADQSVDLLQSCSITKSGMWAKPMRMGASSRRAIACTFSTVAVLISVKPCRRPSSASR